MDARSISDHRYNQDNHPLMEMMRLLDHKEAWRIHHQVSVEEVTLGLDGMSYFRHGSMNLEDLQKRSYVMNWGHSGKPEVLYLDVVNLSGNDPRLPAYRIKSNSTTIPVKLLNEVEQNLFDEIVDNKLREMNNG